MNKIDSRKIKALFIDLDGTLYFKDRPIEGAADAINQLRNQGFILKFLTNTDSQTNLAIQNKLNSYQLKVELDEIYTPLSASLKFLKNLKDKTFFPLVSNNILPEYTTLNMDDQKVDYVVIGDFRDRVSYELLNRAFRLIADGAEIIALQKGKFFYNSEGKNLDTGAFVQLFEYASDKKALVLGKPSQEFFQIILKELKLQPDQIAIIGDDLATDIRGAKDLGAFSVLVKTGKYQDNSGFDPTLQPELIISSIAEISGHII
ncbi:MAG: TIGR01458 family HAD-type hydrolase [Firmicutes bacterium]|nr:TIGR01458 family HAD-type hydrolase [Bacillota bacterium]